jgi:hypothetical protein
LGDVDTRTYQHVLKPVLTNKGSDLALGDIDPGSELLRRLDAQFVGHVLISADAATEMLDLKLVSPTVPSAVSGVGIMLHLDGVARSENPIHFFDDVPQVDEGENSRRIALFCARP